MMGLKLIQTTIRGHGYFGGSHSSYDISGDVDSVIYK